MIETTKTEYLTYEGRDAATDGRADADYDYHHVGSDFACDIKADIVSPDIILRVAEAHAFCVSFEDAHGAEWYEGARERFLAEGYDHRDENIRVAARTYAMSYTARYMERIRADVMAHAQDAAAIAKARDAQEGF